MNMHYGNTIHNYEEVLAIFQGILATATHEGEDDTAETITKKSKEGDRDCFDEETVSRQEIRNTRHYTLSSCYHANGVTSDWVAWQMRRWKKNPDKDKYHKLQLIKKAAKEAIRDRLVSEAVSGRIPKQGVTMAIFVLKNHHGMSDQVQHKVEADVKVKSKIKWGDNEIEF